MSFGSKKSSTPAATPVVEPPKAAVTDPVTASQAASTNPSSGNAAAQTLSRDIKTASTQARIRRGGRLGGASALLGA